MNTKSFVCLLVAQIFMTIVSDIKVYGGEEGVLTEVEARQRAGEMVKTIPCKESSDIKLHVSHYDQANPLETLLIFDFDNVIGRGMGRDGQRFDKNGTWQPRCAELLQFFKALKEKKGDYVQIVSSGTAFSVEKEYFAGSTQPVQCVRISDALYQFLDLGFYVKPASVGFPGFADRWRSKGEQIINIIKHLNIRVKQVVFIDDQRVLVDGVAEAMILYNIQCFLNQKADDVIATCCLWWPTEEQWKRYNLIPEL